MSRYKYTTNVSFDNSDEGGPDFDVEISYSVSWGTPEHNPHNCPPELYDPSSPSIPEDIKIDLVDGKPRPWGMGFGYISDDEFQDSVLEKINDDDLIVNASEIEESRAPD